MILWWRGVGGALPPQSVFLVDFHIQNRTVTRIEVYNVPSMATRTTGIPPYCVAKYPPTRLAQK